MEKWKDSEEGGGWSMDRAVEGVLGGVGVNA